MMNDLIDHLVRRASPKWQSPGRRLVEHDAEAEEIGTVIELPSQRLFRRHVQHRAQDGA